MKLSEIGMPKGANKKNKRVGRGQGSGHGKTSCRGEKGQMSRSGHKKGGSYIGFEGGQMPLMRRLPKRGFTNIFREELQIVNISQLNIFKENEVVDLNSLKEKGIVKEQVNAVKILGDGELKKALTVKSVKFSKSAIKKIQDAGGKIENA